MRSYVLILAVLALTGCFQDKEINKLNLNGSILEIVQKNRFLYQRKEHLIYYYPGDCSICYGNISALSKRFSKIPLTVVSSSTDTVLIREYSKKIGYSGKVFIDSNNKFFNANRITLEKASIFLINTKNEILDQAELALDQKTSNRFAKLLKIN